MVPPKEQTMNQDINRAYLKKEAVAHLMDLSEQEIQEVVQLTLKRKKELEKNHDNHAFIPCGSSTQ